MLPSKRAKRRLEEAKAPERVWNRHRKFVREHECVVTLAGVRGECKGIIEFAHVRSAANAGTGIKPHDRYGVSMCTHHHDEQHQIGQPGFMDKYGICLFSLAEEFYRKSPLYREMKADLEKFGEDS